MGWFCVSAHGQAVRVRPNVTRLRPNLVTGGTLSLSVSPTKVTFNLVSGGVANGSSAVTITSSWRNVTGLGIKYDLYGYFSSASAALSNSTNSLYVIPSSEVYGTVAGTYSLVTSATPFTSATPYSGSSGLDLASASGLLSILGSGSFTSTLSLKIDLTSQPKLPAGQYLGTLTLQAQAN